MTPRCSPCGTSPTSASSSRTCAASRSTGWATPTFPCARSGWTPPPGERMSPMTMRARSLGTRLLWGTLLIIAVVMTAVMLVVEHRQRTAIVDEVQRRGEVLARGLAATAQAPLLLYNFTALEQNVAQAAAEDDVPYAIVLDADGRVAAHSERPERVGLLLHGALDRKAAEATGPLVQETVTETGEGIYDFAVPIVVGQQKWGTARIGVSKLRMEQLIRRTRWELGGLTAAMLVVGGLAAALVARRISRPVQQLAAGAAAVSRGELDLQVAPATDDEIGDLAIAFNHMTAQLRQQRGALEDANTELRRRLEELADLKSYTDNVLASMTNGLITVDLDGRVVTLNPAAELMTGFFAGEATGRYCTDVFEATPQLGEILMETIASRTAYPGMPV